MARDRLDNFWLRGLREIFAGKGNRILKLYCFAHAIDQVEMTGCKTAVDIARKLFGSEKKKAAVSRCIGVFQDKLELDREILGQRKADGRKQMSEKRKSQLKTKKEK